ncbi:hypothetical protein [Adhaeribacter rhizoryzae]|uniref:hypothetical protein n=1 Tax=Adhaeribacter rhizoryzae TaxID=2607907 RepID=UPI001CC1DA8E
MLEVSGFAELTPKATRNSCLSVKFVTLNWLVVIAGLVVLECVVVAVLILTQESLVFDCHWATIFWVLCSADAVKIISEVPVQTTVWVGKLVFIV